MVDGVSFVFAVLLKFFSFIYQLLSSRTRVIFLFAFIGKAFCLKPFHTGARCFQFGDTKISVPLKTRGRHVVTRC